MSRARQRGPPQKQRSRDCRTQARTCDRSRSLPVADIGREGPLGPTSVGSRHLTTPLVQRPALANTMNRGQNQIGGLILDLYGARNLTTDLVGPLGEGLARIPSQIGLVVRSSSPNRSDGWDQIILLILLPIFCRFSVPAGGRPKTAVFGPGGAREASRKTIQDRPMAGTRWLESGKDF